MASGGKEGRTLELAQAGEGVDVGGRRGNNPPTGRK